MSTPLQDFTPDKSSYERPTLPWVCGRIPEGCPCHIGPSISGDCQAGLECIPYRDGDGFVCARPPAWGGTCETGPLPDGKCCQTVVLCQPRRSIRMRRQIISVCCVGLILGLLLLITGSDSASRDAFISPGELTLQHHSSRQRCSDCHTNAELTLKRMDTAEGLPDIAIQDSLKCLACHDLGDTPFNPHALPIPELASLTDAAQDGGNTASTPWLISLARRFGTSPMQTGELACSRCHKEHRGRVSDLTQLADEQCQICHTHTFHSFASGHPEFDGFPYSRRTRIHFDHTTHYGTHFANFKRVMPHGERPANCGSCHTPDSDRRMMPVVGFEKACGSCHAGQMQGPYTDIAFFAIPELDIHDQPVGEWPVGSAGFRLTAPEELPAFMRLLLTTQAEWRLGQRLLLGADDEATSRRGHQKLAVATKMLIVDLVENGQSALRDRLLTALGKDGDELVAASLAEVTTPLIETLRRGSRQWFPSLEHEADSLSGDSPPERVEVSISGGLESLRNEGWHIGATQSMVRFRPLRHADPVPRELINALVQIPGIDKQPDGHTSMEALRELFHVLTDPRGAFRCTACHSIDRTDNGTLTVNWKALDSKTSERDLVTFSHAPHVMLLHSNSNSSQSQKCDTCHQLESLEHRNRKFVHPQFEQVSGRFSVNIDGTTPFSSGFDKVEKMVCAECHTRQLAGDRCLNCHNYHADR